MDYNKFIYKINKYKLYLRDKKKKRKDHYQNKIDFYYAKINNLTNKKGGAFTNEDLVKFIEPTTLEVEKHLDKNANIKVFQSEQKKYEENHKKILQFLDKLLEANTDLNRFNSEAKEKIDIITQEMKNMDETHKREIRNKLKQIKEKVDTQKKLTLIDIQNRLNKN